MQYDDRVTVWTDLGRVRGQTYVAPESESYNGENNQALVINMSTPRTGQALTEI